MDEVRKAGDYTVINSMKIGGHEIVLGENMDDKNRNYYLVADYECNEIFARYKNVYVSEDYVEMAEMFVKRMSEEIEKLKQNRADRSLNVIPKAGCIPIGNETFTDKIIVLKPETLCPEYRNEHYQIVRCTGGNGAKADGLGTSVFCREMFSGEDVKYRRADVMGILKEENYPKWLIDALTCEKEMNNPDVFQYGKYHFLPVGYLPDNEDLYGRNRYCHHDETMRFWNIICEKNYGRANENYSYRDFYKASGRSKYNVFKCLENRNLYLPGENELFRYTGKYKEIGKEKKKPHREAER